MVKKDFGMINGLIFIYKRTLITSTYTTLNSGKLQHISNIHNKI